MRIRMMGGGWELIRPGIPKAKYILNTGKTPREQLEAESRKLRDKSPEELAQLYGDLTRSIDDSESFENLTNQQLARRYRDTIGL